MLRLISLTACLAVLLWMLGNPHVVARAVSMMAVANEYPSIPEGGITLLQVTDCTDGETGEKGTCQAYQGADGTIYVTFWQNDVMMFVRKVVGDSYETTWVNDLFQGV